MSKLEFFVFIFIFSFLFQLSTSQSQAYVFNTSNGVSGVGIWILDGIGGGTSGQDFYGGGTVQIDWRDFEPEEGKYNWGLIKPGWEIIPGTSGSDDPTRFVSWKGYFDKWLCENNQLGPCNANSYIVPQPVAGVGILEAANRGKKVRFKIRVTDGALPLWLHGVQRDNTYNYDHGGAGGKEIAFHMGPHQNGVYDAYPGATVCASKTNQQAWTNSPDCNPLTDINTAVTYPLYPSKESNSQPVWWNPIFQEKFKKTLSVIAARMERDPDILKAVDYIEASVGNFGEMILYGKSETSWAYCNNNPTLTNGPEECWCTQRAANESKCRQDQIRNTDGTQNKTNFFCTYAYRKPEANHAPHGVNLWLRSGYTNKKYYDSVMSLLTAYTDSFQKIPIALSKGSGLYAGDPYIYRNNCTTIPVDDVDQYPYRMDQWVISDALERWGARIYLKFAGFPEGEVTTFQTYCPSTTKCIYETFGPISQWNLEGVLFPFKKPEETNSDAKNRFFRGLSRVNQAHTSVLMMWTGDFDLLNQSAYSHLKPAVSEAALFIGPQISLSGGVNGITLGSSSVVAGTALSIKTVWTNATYASLWGTKRVFHSILSRGKQIDTYKDVLISRPIYLDLVNGSDQVIYKTTYIPTNGTQNWILANGPNGIFESSDQVFIPWSVPPGTYTLRIGLPINDALTKFWKFNNLSSITSEGVYLTGKTITVTSPTTTGVSFRPGWNFIRWPSNVSLTNNQVSDIWSSCSIKSQLSFGNTVINNFSVLPVTLTSGVSYFFNCQKALW